MGGGGDVCADVFYPHAKGGDDDGGAFWRSVSPVHGGDREAVAEAFCQRAQNRSGGAAMIRGVHTMFYSAKAKELRKFLREKLGFSATDVGEGWLIFDLPEADMGVHPTDRSGPAS